MVLTFGFTASVTSLGEDVNASAIVSDAYIDDIMGTWEAEKVVLGDTVFTTAELGADFTIRIEDTKVIVESNSMDISEESTYTYNNGELEIKISKGTITVIPSQDGNMSINMDLLSGDRFSYTAKQTAVYQKPTPTPEPTATPTPMPTATPTPKPTATPKPAATPTPKPTATPTPKPTATPTPKPTATPKPKPTATPKPTSPKAVTQDPIIGEWDLKYTYYGEDDIESAEGSLIIDSDSFTIYAYGTYLTEGTWDVETGDIYTFYAETDEGIAYLYGTLFNNNRDFLLHLTDDFNLIFGNHSTGFYDDYKTYSVSSDTYKDDETSYSSTATYGQKNALEKARDYLEVSAFSYTGLIDQLEYVGYSHSEATYGADHCGADWKEQALKKANSYLDYSNFSYSGLVDQLEYVGFSNEEAVYAVDRCGADWYEQAVEKARSYLEFSSFSYSELVDQLEFVGFTYEQAAYGAKKAN